nr:MAG TPA: hypothetical protein [Caudoviricetes sp.]
MQGMCLSLGALKVGYGAQLQTGVDCIAAATTRCGSLAKTRLLFCTYCILDKWQGCDIIYS